jgi:hypothetical protein
MNAHDEYHRRGPMASRSLYRTLVPDAPLHRRTEVDEPREPEFELRTRAAREVVPGLQSPMLVSSFDGAIEKVLFCFPYWSVAEPSLTRGYTSVIQALRVGTQFVVAHNVSARAAVEQWFADAGHPAEKVKFIPLPDYVAVTDWAEDAYVSLNDSADATSYLMEPWEFGRFGDALIADAVEEYTDVKASQAPLIFQGGNCLVGSDFWLLGKDYFADTLDLFIGDRPPPVEVPAGQDPRSFAVDLFSQYVDGTRTLSLVGTKKAIPVQPYVGTREGDSYFLDLTAGGVGTFQPIFHIDMFLTLVGVNSQGTFEILVGSPSAADEVLGTTSPFALSEVYDDIARTLERSGFAVRRNPLVHRATPGARIELRRIKQLASEPGNEALAHAVRQLEVAGATDTTMVQVRDWHHITWNNCLVENSTSVGKHVYLPTFGHGENSDLAVIDSQMKSLWEELGFTVHLLEDFNDFARRQGVVHCIKKYLTRST